MPAMSPMSSAEQHADDERPDARLDGEPRAASPIVRVQLVRQVRDRGATPTRIPTTIATASQRRRAARRRSRGPAGRRRWRPTGTAGRRGHAPAHRPEDPFADPERDADDEQEDREDDEDEGQRAEGDDPADLAGDRGRLGLGEVDVGDDEGHRRVAGRADLGAKARRWHLWTAWLDGGGGGGGGVRGGGSVGIWSSRGVLRLRDRMRGSAAMIAAHRARPVAGNAPRYAAGHVRCALAATPDGRAAEHRQRADGRRDARHERRRAGPLADRARRPGRPA